MGSSCSCKINMDEPENLLLFTERERRFARAQFQQRPQVVVDKAAVEEVDNTGLVEVCDVRGIVHQQTLGLQGVTTRPRMESWVMDSFKALFTKNSTWVGKLKFDMDEGIQTHVSLKYRVLGFTRDGDVEAERQYWEEKEKGSELAKAKSIPAKMYFDVFFEGDEAEPAMIFKCEDTELVLVVDTRLKNANVSLDVQHRCLEGIGYRQQKELSDPESSDFNEPSAPLPSWSSENKYVG